MLELDADDRIILAGDRRQIFRRSSETLWPMPAGISCRNGRIIDKLTSAVFCAKAVAADDASSRLSVQAIEAPGRKSVGSPQRKIDFGLTSTHRLGDAGEISCWWERRRARPHVPLLDEVMHLP